MEPGDRIGNHGGVGTPDVGYIIDIVQGSGQGEASGRGHRSGAIIELGKNIENILIIDVYWIFIGLN
jgi:hypothetical protein